jgi:pyridoxal/pyridoxine/pyridoxamine kinase
MNEITMVETSGVRNRLTITPTRVELKIISGTSEETLTQIKKFVTLLHNKMNPITQSWRGKISLLEMGGEPVLATSLQTNNSKKCRHFIEPLSELTN